MRRLPPKRATTLLPAAPEHPIPAPSVAVFEPETESWRQIATIAVDTLRPAWDETTSVSCPNARKGRP
jgi:hypothetical protein